MSSKNSRVVVVGGGVIGPTLALLLKQKGYEPIIVEKVNDVGASGMAIAIHSNGLKVLDRAGVTKDLLPGVIPWQVWNEYTAEGEFLGGPASKLIGKCSEKYGWPCVGISRTRLQLTLRETAIGKGIEFLQGWKLKDIQESEQGIVAEAEDGRKIEAAFLIGCDGLKSAARQIIHKKKGVKPEEPDFTNIAVIGGISPTPTFLRENSGAHLWYGDKVCIISHPIENQMSVWGLNYPQSSAVDESWKPIPSDQIPAKIAEYSEEFRDWAEPVRELIKGTQRLLTIGLYDRPEIPVEHWFHGRCMVLGDAAHPSTPHIGQGANQGLEDCWHLIQQLPDFNGLPISTQELQNIFRQVATIRLPRTAELVKQARTQGNLRVVTGGPGAREDRNAKLRDHWGNVEAISVAFDAMYTEPFRDPGGWERLQLGKVK